MRRYAAVTDQPLRFAAEAVAGSETRHVVGQNHARSTNDERTWIGRINPLVLFSLSVLALLVVRAVPESMVLRLPFAAIVPGDGFPPATVHVKLLMQVVISLAVLYVGLRVILAKSLQQKDKNWAYGAIGTIIGYWLKV